MNEIELQNAVNDFENRLLEGSDATTARAALRNLLFRLADSPQSGSLGDAVEIIASRAQPSPTAASAILRALAADGLVQDNAANHLARNIVFVVENGLPGLSDFLGLRQKNQTYEKLELLRGASNWVESQLAPLRVSYTTLDSMLEARKAVLSSLSHGRLVEFGNAFHLPEVRDAIVSVYASLDDVSKIAARATNSG
jgi:hypothetical protein